MPNTPPVTAPITVLYFAWLRERAGTSEERLALPASVGTVDALVAWLTERSPGHRAAFENRAVIRCAVNQEFAPPSAPIRPGDEIAFFPPSPAADMARISVQAEDFDLGRELAALTAGNTRIGGVGSFIGVVRDTAGTRRLVALTLEHYPRMTEQAIARVAAQAEQRWELLGCTVIHRTGKLHPGDNIVLVLAAATHRHAALEATAFLIDWLKTKAPFWKKESFTDGTEDWVDARDTDDQAASRWAPIMDRAR